MATNIALFSSLCFFSSLLHYCTVVHSLRRYSSMTFRFIPLPTLTEEDLFGTSTDPISTRPAMSSSSKPDDTSSAAQSDTTPSETTPLLSSPPPGTLRTLSLWKNPRSPPPMEPLPPPLNPFSPPLEPRTSPPTEQQQRSAHVKRQIVTLRKIWLCQLLLNVAILTISVFLIPMLIWYITLKRSSVPAWCPLSSKY